MSDLFDLAPGPSARGGRNDSGPSLIGRILVHAATGAPIHPPASQPARRSRRDDERQFRWAMEGGLGPLLHAAVDPDAGWPVRWREAMLAADLTARVRHGDLVDTALDILDVCERLGVEATLLKGISVSEQLYPAEHLRPMADVDVLVPHAEYSRVETGLLECGYLRLPGPHVEADHHGAPLRHSSRRTLVELHTDLFPPASLLHGQSFSHAHIESQKRSSRYHGRPVSRLSDELQLVYIAASWFNDMTSSRFHPSFVASLLDAVYLLRARRQPLDWTGMLGWIDNDMVKASLYAMLTYLPRFGVEAVPAEVLAGLGRNRGLVGPIQRRAIHAALDRYLIGGRSWPFALPPPVPGRYSPRHQIEKRVVPGRRA
jgi:hypothetical protein